MSLVDFQIMDISHASMPLHTGGQGEMPPVNADSIRQRKMAPVNADLTCRIVHLSKIFVRPFVSAFSAFSNWHHTRHRLTTNLVLNNANIKLLEFNQFFNYAAFTTLTLDKAKDRIDNLSQQENGTYVTAIPLECRPNLLDHSTTIAIVSTVKDGKVCHQGMLFDAQGHSPDNLPLCSNAVINFGNQPEKAMTVKEVYERLMSGQGEIPPLVYSAENIQADWVSCTAYTAQFLMSLGEHLRDLENSESFDAASFMHKVANGDLVTFLKARETVRELPARIRP